MYYNDLNTYLRSRFGCKVYKLSLSSRTTCPNRDGACGERGCIFCDGAGAFAADGASISDQLAAAKERVRAKVPENARYIAYFQSFTATYAPIEQLRRDFSAAMADSEVVALSMATRPDCLPSEVVALLAELNREKPVWVELGLQTIHEGTARFIRRGYTLPVFEDAVRRLRAAGLEVIVHLILGLPDETEAQMLESVRWVGQQDIQGVKLHLLHVLEGTDLAALYRETPFSLPDLPEYIALLERCLALLPPEIVIHRLTGDGAKRDLIAPLWTGDKKRVLNAIRNAFLRDDVRQGSALSEKTRGNA